MLKDPARETRDFEQERIGCIAQELIDGAKKANSNQREKRSEKIDWMKDEANCEDPYLSSVPVTQRY